MAGLISAVSENGAGHEISYSAGLEGARGLQRLELEEDVTGGCQLC